MIHQCSICDRIHDCGESPEECDLPIIIPMNCRDHNTWEEIHYEQYLSNLSKLKSYDSN